MKGENARVLATGLGQTKKKALGIPGDGKDTRVHRLGWKDQNVYVDACNCTRCNTWRADGEKSPCPPLRACNGAAAAAAARHGGVADAPTTSN